MQLKNKRFSLQEVLIKALYEANAVGVYESQLTDEFASCFETMTHQNHSWATTNLMASRISRIFGQKRREKMKLLKADCDFCLAKNANFSKRRNKDLPLNIHGGQKNVLCFT